MPASSFIRSRDPEFATPAGIIESPNEWSMSFWNDDTGQINYGDLSEAAVLLAG